MSWTRESIETFLITHLQGANAMNLDAIAASYNDPFMFAGPSGVRVVPVQPFLAALPARRAFFDQIGQLGTELVSFEETVLDEHYVVVKTQLKMRFQRPGSDLTEAILGSTFLLFDDGDHPRIVFHLEARMSRRRCATAASCRRSRRRCGAVMTAEYAETWPLDCPICEAALRRHDAVLSCDNGHSFESRAKATST